jgi:hypothetical protein
VNTRTLKVMAASAGAGAVIAMGGLSVAANSWAEPEPAPPGPVEVSSEATIAQTSTETTAPPTPTEPSASPEITGPAPLPSEEEGVPG